MPDEATSAIEAGIRSAFTAYSRDDDPDWRSATWIKPEECSHLAMSIVNTPPPKGGGFRFRLEAGLIDPSGRFVQTTLKLSSGSSGF